MVLSEFTYREASGWHVERLKLNPQNLIVGLNSVGKSRTISAIGHVASFIKGEVDAQGDFSCSRENEAEDVRSQMDDVRGSDSRSAARNDSTEKGGITLNTEWGPDSTVNF
jgi:predicted ATPase